MTHFKTFILSCLLALAAFPATAKDADFTVDGFGYSITSTTSLIVEVASGPNEADVTVPSTVVFNNRTFRVTGISYDAFQNHKKLRSVDMPSITYIEGGDGDFFGTYNGAFTGCSNLSDVNMPVATSIGNAAFSDCYALTSVSLPVATSIGDGAFWDCYALTSISLPAATSIGKGAFGGCYALASFSLPAATSIGFRAFGGCHALTSINLTAVTSIGDGAFIGCNALCDIYVGDQPAQCFDDPFSKVTYATATLHVPAGCASKYKAAGLWKNFAFISEDYDPTGIKSTKVNDVKIYTDNGSVQLTGLKEGEKVLFYSLDGKLIGAQKANSGTVSITTSEPVVICKMGGKSIKILVK